ncbi:MAG TPA: nuclear transport factor 2 family protein [Vicinamibacteria bacterium]|jgi:ketosteroid isomerase-like protein
MRAEEREVREANDRFYRALNDLDLGGMDRIWSHASFVRCVHPGWELIVGWEAVRASWEGIFQGSSGGPSHAVEIADVSVHVADDLGWVSCIERITFSRRPGGAAASASLAVATNLFQRSTGDERAWRMILHHASLLPLVVPSGAGPKDTPEVIH